MSAITSIRAPMAVAETPPLAVMGSEINTRAQGNSASVSPTVLAESLQQVVPKTRTSDAQLLAVRMTAETPAIAAAEAARVAYIKASIAAGINPLPMG